MKQIQILLLFVIALSFGPAWAMHNKPACKLLPCPTHRLCLADVPGFVSKQWTIKATEGQCGPGRDIMDCCLCSHYQEFEVTKAGNNSPSFKGASSILCALCHFSSFSSENARTTIVYEGDRVENRYEQCQLFWCCGCTESEFDKRESCAIHFLGNGLVCVVDDIIQTIDCLWCFNSCHPDSGEAPIAYEMNTL